MILTATATTIPITWLSLVFFVAPLASWELVDEIALFAAAPKTMFVGSYLLPWLPIAASAVATPAEAAASVVKPATVFAAISVAAPATFDEVTLVTKLAAFAILSPLTTPIAPNANAPLIFVVFNLVTSPCFQSIIVHF